MSSLNLLPKAVTARTYICWWT